MQHNQACPLVYALTAVAADLLAKLNWSTADQLSRARKVLSPALLSPQHS